MGLERNEKVEWVIICDECKRSRTHTMSTEVDVKAAAVAAGFDSPIGDRTRGWL